MEWVNKPIFNGLLHSGMPDMDALYRVGQIPMVSRTNVSGGLAGWADKLSLPTSSWYDAMVSQVHAPRNIIMVDHEDWTYTTQADRRATAEKYVTVYQEIKSRRPEWRIGWYMDPIRRDYWRATKPIGGAEYRAWQAENDDLGKIMAPYTDVFMPSLYFFYTRDTYSANVDALGLYLVENIKEAQRIRRVYGRLEAPIYPYIWWRRHDGTRDLDADSWETIVRTVLEEADGMVLWGGYQTLWDENAPWWVTIKARLTDKLRTQ
jgi:hypothetical protein